MSREERKVVREYREIRRDYAFDPDVFNDDPERVRRAKQVISELPPADRILFLMYADTGSLRKLAARLQLSHTTLNKEIQRIRKEIIAKI